ncbi:hypothetical protein CS0771_38610 [Catellatospora sp. IY07-71]|uniref:DUF427 domain-containing protein n=1 Tax=Catellatospora sp. IY07-71 TaxID=2728827 RepID=UPI001BB3D51C|nr:DUF427 domain-containing protein [Catellatospora sp. IY07-71]BCJ74317.1 hypothetical protein CS0771_38610 [Catellatospora sp. IY07-71]
MRVRALWRGTVLADGPDTVRRDGAVYFPREAVRWAHLRPSGTRTLCPWKGVAVYYTAEAGGATGRDLAWSYRYPWPWAWRLRRRVAFGPPVTLEPVAPRADPSGPSARA